MRAKALSDKELKSKRKALLGSKSGVLIATMLLGCINARAAMKKQRLITVSASELDRFMGEVIEGLVHLRDAYVEEVERHGDTDKRWREFIASQKEKPKLVLAK